MLPQLPAVEGEAELGAVVAAADPAPQHEIVRRAEHDGRLDRERGEPVDDVPDVGRPRRVEQLRPHRHPTGLVPTQCPTHLAIPSNADDNRGMSAVVDAVRRVIAPLTRTRVFRRIGPVVMPVAEAVMRRLTGGRVVLSGLLVPSLVLHSTGAKSGERRRVELMYTPDGRGRAIVAGTSFARERHPGWTYNLLAHPEAEIEVRGRRYRVIASLLDDPEAREAAWARIERQWPGYRAYERESGRTVRLFLLRPVELLDG